MTKKLNIQEENENKTNQDNQNNQQEKLIELENKVKEIEEGWRRSMADFENYRKRTETQKFELINFAKADFMAKVTPVLDNFRRAFEHVPEEEKNSNFIIGVKSIEKQLEDILNEEGLKKIETTGIFNPNLHEAISCEESEIPTDHIIGEVEGGWQFNDKVIKPAKVRVSKGK